MKSFRVFDFFEERVPVYQYEYLGGSAWVCTSFNSRKDFEAGLNPDRSFVPESQVLSDRNRFESHWHNYEVVEF